MNLRTAITTVQAATFVALAVVLYHAGEWRLATAQILLGVITFLLYL